MITREIGAISRRGIGCATCRSYPGVEVGGLWDDLLGGAKAIGMEALKSARDRLVAYGRNLGPGETRYPMETPGPVPGGSGAPQIVASAPADNSTMLLAGGALLLVGLL